MVHRGQSSLSTKSLRRCWQLRHSSQGTGKPRRLAAPPSSSHPSCRKDFDQSRAEGPVSGKRKRKNKTKPLLHMLWNSWKETFIAIKRYKIEELFCVKETEGEGSRARGARQGERRLRPICGCAATTPLKRLPREPDPGWWRILMPARYTRKRLCYWLHRLDTTHTKSANVSAVPFRGGVG